MKYFMASLFLFSAAFCVEESPEEDPTSNAAIFAINYATGEWDQESDVKGTSGSGSSPVNAKMYIEYLRDFLKTKQITSVVDLGCGDWQIARLIDWSGIQYTGIDVVKSVIEKNKKEFSAKNITFIRADGIDYTLPRADLLICKDVLQHLPFNDIAQVLPQLSKFKYCILVNDVDPVTLTCENTDLPRGHYRVLDMTLPPFSLKGRKVLTYASANETKQVLLIEN